MRLNKKKDLVKDFEETESERDVPHQFPNDEQHPSPGQHFLVVVSRLVLSVFILFFSKCIVKVFGFVLVVS